MFLKNITKYQVQKYTIKAMGASAVVVAIVGAILISNTTLTSYSDMFYVHRQYFAWVLSLLGIVLIWCRVEVGVGFVMLAVFDTGDIHNYIASPLIVILMLSYYIRKKQYYWLVPQILVGIIQGIIYIWFHNPPNEYFYFTEMAGLMVGGVFLVWYSDNLTTIDTDC